MRILASKRGCKSGIADHCKNAVTGAARAAAGPQRRPMSGRRVSASGVAVYLKSAKACTISACVFITNGP